MVAKGVQLKRGKSIRIPSTFKQGMFDEEYYFQTDIRALRNQLIHGFAPKEDANLEKGYVLAVILGFLDEKKEIVRLLFPGELLAPSNPVAVKREIIQRIQIAK
jgi:hypothetical protein